MYRAELSKVCFVCFCSLNVSDFYTVVLLVAGKASRVQKVYLLFVFDCCSETFHEVQIAVARVAQL